MADCFDIPCEESKDEFFSAYFVALFASGRVELPKGKMTREQLRGIGRQYGEEALKAFLIKEWACHNVRIEDLVDICPEVYGKRS